MRQVQSLVRMTAGTTYKDVRDGWSDGSARMREVAALNEPLALAMARRSGSQRDVGPELLEAYVLGTLVHMDDVVDAYERYSRPLAHNSACQVIARMGATVALGRLAGHAENTKRMAVMWRMIGASRQRATAAVRDAYDWMVATADRSAGRYLRARGKAA